MNEPTMTPQQLAERLFQSVSSDDQVSSDFYISFLRSKQTWRKDVKSLTDILNDPQ